MLTIGARLSGALRPYTCLCQSDEMNGFRGPRRPSVSEGAPEGVVIKAMAGAREGRQHPLLSSCFRCVGLWFSWVRPPCAHLRPTSRASGRSCRVGECRLNIYGRASTDECTARPASAPCSSRWSQRRKRSSTTKSSTTRSSGRTARSRGLSSTYYHTSHTQPCTQPIPRRVDTT